MGYAANGMATESDQILATGLGALTDKQCAVLDLVLLHRTNKEIARTLEISPSAVEQRLASAKAKLGAASRFDAALAYQALRETCGDSTGESEQVGLLTLGCHSPLRELEEPILEFHDAISFDGRRREDRATTLEFLEAVSAPSGVWARLGLILGFALVLVLVASVALNVAQGAASILGA